MTMTRPRSTAAREWFFHSRLRAAGIPTPVPVGVGERSYCGLERESFFLSLAVERGESLKVVVSKGFGLEPGQGTFKKRVLGGALALAVRELHQAGFIHGDLHVGHLVVVTRVPEGFEVLFTDLETVRPIRHPLKDVIQDLASLNQSVRPSWASRADRLRFFKTYAQVTRLGPSEKEMIRRIVQQAARLERQACDLR